MSKISELSELLVSKNHLPQADADRFVRIMFDVINSQLHRDRLVKVKGLGTFKLTTVKDRESINVTTGERITIEGRDKISFIPDPVLRDLVNKPFSEFETVELNDGVDFSSMPGEEEHEDEDTPSSIAATEPDAEPEESDVVPKEPEATAEEPEAETEEPVARADEPKAETNESAAEDITPTTKENKPTTEEGRDEIAESTPRPKAGNPEDGQVPVVVAPAPKKTLMERAFDEEKPLSSQQPNERQAEDESESKVDRRHVVVSKASLWIWGLLAVVLFAGIGLLAYSYGRVTAERDQLAQLVARQDQHGKAMSHQNSKTPPRKASSAAPVQPGKKDSAALVTPQAPASGEAGGNPTTASAKDEQRQSEPTATHTPTPAEREKASASTSSIQQNRTDDTPTAADEARYNRDPRIRTGAYRIVGVDRVVTARKGQSLAGISKSQLGSGMECYVEALNGKGPIKEGQKIKIPKLRLKKRK